MEWGYIQGRMHALRIAPTLLSSTFILKKKQPTMILYIIRSRILEKDFKMIGIKLRTRHVKYEREIRLQPLREKNIFLLQAI